MKFSEQIIQIRNEYNLTQEDLAKKLNVTRQAVSKWERDLTYPDIEILKYIAKNFNISLNVLLGLIDNTKSKDIKPLAYKSYASVFFSVLAIILFFFNGIVGSILIIKGLEINPVATIACFFSIPIGFIILILDYNSIVNHKTRISYNDYGLYVNVSLKSVEFIPFDEILEVRARTTQARNFHWYTFGKIIIETKKTTIVVRGLAEVDEIKGRIIELKTKNTMMF